MLFSRKFIVFLFCFFLPCHTLRCTKNCSYTLNFTQPFNIPDRCNQIVSAGKCTSYVEFSYTHQTYSVRIDADPSASINENQNRRHVFMMLREASWAYFTYDITYVCKNTDDCARDLITNATKDILQQQFKVSPIVNELIPFITAHQPPTNYTLKCFDPKGLTVQCGISANYSGQCVIEHNIKADSIIRSCNNKEPSKSVLVSIFQTPNAASFNINCNQSLCNNHSTLESVKKIMFKYKVTAMLDGQLPNEKFILNYGLKLMTSILLMITMIFSLILNYQ